MVHQAKCATRRGGDCDCRPTMGVRERHSRSCSSRKGGSCDCEPSYEATVYSRKDHKKIRRVFPTLAGAKGWLTDARSEVKHGRMRAPTPLTLREAAERWLKLAKAGIVRNRSGDEYKPSVLRGYEELLELRLLPELGSARLSELARPDLQLLVGEWQATRRHRRRCASRRGAPCNCEPSVLSPSSIRNALMPLRAIYRDLELLGVPAGAVPINPTTGLRLPAVRGRRVRIVSPADAERFLERLASADRPLWATAFWGGLRRGELAALRWPDVDLAQGVIRVERSWDFKTGQAVTPKSRAGRRRVPIPAVLRDELVERRMDSGSEILCFGESADQPFRPSGVDRRARATWRTLSLEPLTLHDARHTFASLMIAAGANAKAISSYMGHSSIQVTFDLYGHLMPGNEAEAAALLDRYLEHARGEAARAAAP
jgi:integrase